MERTFKEAIKLNMLNELRVEEGETGKFILQDEVISINEKNGRFSITITI